MSLYIENKIPKKFTEIEIKAEQVMVPEINASIAANQMLICLYCELLKNITLIIKKDEIKRVVFLLDTKEQFEDMVSRLKAAYKNVEFYERNKKINGFAASVVDQMRNGYSVTIVPSTDRVSVPICPDCGMQCDPSIPYCMECGASI